MIRMRSGFWTAVCLLALCELAAASAASSASGNRDMTRALRGLYSKKRGKERANLASKLSGEYVPEAGPWSSPISEPTCEQLREMWRQSKRHSRAAEATNEIPQYEDPFARALPSYARQQMEDEQRIVGALRPRPERRPIVYGRVQSIAGAGDASDRSPLRPLDALRKLHGREIGADGSVFDKADPPVKPASAKGSLQRLRDMSRDELGGSVASTKGGFQRLRDVIRDEQGGGPLPPSKGAMQRLRETIRRDASSAWQEDDQFDRTASSSAAMYAMQGDEPYSSSSAGGSQSLRPKQHRPFPVVRPGRKLEQQMQRFKTDRTDPATRLRSGRPALAMKQQQQQQQQESDYYRQGIEDFVFEPDVDDQLKPKLPLTDRAFRRDRQAARKSVSSIAGCGS